MTGIEPALSAVVAFAQALAIGASSSGSRAAASPPNGSGGLFHAVQGRVVDTRNGIGGFGTSQQPAGKRAYSVTGVFGVPTSGVGAVSVSITAYNPSARGWIDVTADPQPDGTGAVTALDYGAGDTVSNTTIVEIGSDGKISVDSTIAVDLIIDLQGYFTTTASGPAPGGYVPVAPTRLSLANPSLAKNATMNVTVTGSGTGVPADASAVFVNVTVHNQTAAGWVTVYPAGGTRPQTSYNYPDTDAKAFGLSTAINSSGQMAIYNTGASAVNIIVDVIGYFAASNSNGAFNPWQTRVMDTRSDGRSDLAAGAVGTYQVAGLNQVPNPAEGLSAVLVNILAFEPSTGNTGYVRVWPSDQTEPSLSTLNLNPGTPVDNLLPIAVGADGAVKIRNNSSGDIRVTLDVEGWFNSGSSLPQPTGPTCQFSGKRSGSKPITHSLTDRTQMLVNPISGNLNLTGTLLHLKGVKQDVSVSWRYNGLNDARPTLSVGRFETALRPWSNGDFTYVAPDGGCYRFTKSGTGKWDTPPGINGKLKSPSSGTMELRFDPGGVRNTYVQQADNMWVLSKSQDKNDSNPNTVSYTYAASGKLASITDTQGRSVTLAYNDSNNSGQPSTITDTSLNRSIALTYGGPFGALSMITDAAGNTTTLGYGDSGLSSVTDGNNSKTTFGYGANSALTAWTFGAGSSAAANWQASYATSTSTVVTDPNNHAATYTYSGSDESGTVTNVLDGNGHSTSASWDSHDNMMSQTNGSADTTNYSYGNGTGNPNNLISKVTSPNGSGMASGGASQSLTYPTTSSGGQADNDPTSSMDGQSNTTAMSWDSSTHELKSTSTTDSGGNSVGGKKSATYQGDSDNTDCGAKQGEMCSSTSANGNKTTYSYDSTGNMTVMSPPAPLGNRTYTYDAAGRITSQSNGRGNTAYYTYDGDDRITQVSYSSTSCPTATCVTYGYDPAGNKTTRGDASGTTSWTYDPLNRVTAKTLNNTVLSSATYDPANNMTSYTDGYGTVSYNYDGGNRLISLAEPGGSCPATVSSPNSTKCTYFDNDDSNRRIAIRYPNGEKVTTDYDHSSRVKAITATKSNGDVIVKRSYTYASNGSNDAQLVNTMKDENNNTTNYNYDGKNRLTSTTGTDAGSWTYDKDGNRTKNTTGSTTTYSAYNNADELCWTGPTSGSDCSSAPTGSTGYTSDGTGNQLTDSTTAGLVTNTDNVFNQTTQTTIGSTVVPFTYADTTNTERTSSSGTTYANGIAGLDAQTTGNASTYFVRDPSGTLIAMRVGGNSYYYALDALGSVLAVSDASQSTVASYRYGPWGNQTTASGSMATTNPYRYASGYLDAQTGYTKFGARYYNPTTGRFAQPDPDKTWGGYTYTSNNPINNTDPTGRDVFDDVLDDVSTAASGGAALLDVVGWPEAGGVVGEVATATDFVKTGYDCSTLGDESSCPSDLAGDSVDIATAGAGKTFSKIGQTIGDNVGFGYSLASNYYGG